VSEFKVGDKVWVQCEVKQALPDGFQVKGCSGGIPFWVLADYCRPVEPSNSPKILDSSSDPAGDWQPSKNEIEYAKDRCGVPASDPLTPSPCMDGVDVDQFVDGIMEARGRTSDPINPSHYKHLPAEAIDIIEAAIAGAPSNKAAYLHGQSLKYPLRCWEKGGADDLKKARWYLDRLIEEVGE
jgi:hypothetical protein